MGTLDHSKIKALREQKHWEQQDLAQTANIAPSVVSRLERGLQSDFKLSIAVAIATALGVSVDDLLDKNVQSVKPMFTAELHSTLTELAQQEQNIQNYVAGMVQGYLSALKKDGS